MLSPSRPATGGPPRVSHTKVWAARHRLASSCSGVEDQHSAHPLPSPRRPDKKPLSLAVSLVKGEASLVKRSCDNSRTGAPLQVQPILPLCLLLDSFVSVTGDNGQTPREPRMLFPFCPAFISGQAEREHAAKDLMTHTSANSTPLFGLANHTNRLIGPLHPTLAAVSC